MTHYGEVMYTSFDTNPHSHCALVYLSGGFTLAGQFSSHPCPRSLLANQHTACAERSLRAAQLTQAHVLDIVLRRSSRFSGIRSRAEAF